jgi:hypothetical protein
MGCMQCRHRRTAAPLTAAALGLLLSGCDPQFTADLATDPPADPDITAVQVNVRGLEFRQADGGNPTLEFRSGERVDLLELWGRGEPLRLFTDEELPAGQYTGVRLLFDDEVDRNLVAKREGDFPLVLADGNFAAIDFTVTEDEDSEEIFTLMLDLRQSLDFDETVEEYTLVPKLRAVLTQDAARIEGDVTFSCPTGTSLSTGGAVYAYQGQDVQPDDLDGVSPEPLATTRVLDPLLTRPRYELRFLPAGDYTVALTCRGDEDLLGVDDSLDFRVTRNAQVDDGEVLERNLE